MKSKSVETVTTNEESVRLRIFEGDLQLSEAGAELLRIEQAQHAATRNRLAEAQATITELLKQQDIARLRK